MSEEISMYVAVVAVVLIFFGGLYLSIKHSEESRNECVKMVADRPLADIQLICGVKT